MIKLELEVTPKQMTAIGQVLSGHMPVVLDTPLTRDELPARVDQDTKPIAADPDLSQYPIVKPGDTVKISGATGPDADAINGEHQITSPAADAFAADAEQEQEPGKSVTVKTPPATSVLQNTNAQSVGGDLAKGQNGQMIPWDARIHGKAKNKNADGSWRLVQGVDRDTLVPQVEAELVAALAAKPAEGAVVPSPEQLATTQQSSAVVTTTAPAAAPSVPSPPNATAKPTTFHELLPLVTAAKAAGTLTDETIANACAELGLATFGLIATRPDLIPQAAELLGV